MGTDYGRHGWVQSEQQQKQLKQLNNETIHGLRFSAAPNLIHPEAILPTHSALSLPLLQVEWCGSGIEGLVGAAPVVHPSKERAGGVLSEGVSGLTLLDRDVRVA
jgi:hypothetical protein